MATVELDSPRLTTGYNLSREEFLRIWAMNQAIKKSGVDWGDRPHAVTGLKRPGLTQAAERITLSPRV